MGTQAKFEMRKKLDSGSISGTYASIGTATSNAWKKFTITNTTDQTVIVTTDIGLADGVWELPTQSYITEDVSTNDQRLDLVVRKGTLFSVKDDGTPCTSGRVNVQGGLYIE